MHRRPHSLILTLVLVKQDVLSMLFCSEYRILYQVFPCSYGVGSLSLYSPSREYLWRVPDIGEHCVLTHHRLRYFLNTGELQTLFVIHWRFECFIHLWNILIWQENWVFKANHLHHITRLSLIYARRWSYMTDFSESWSKNTTWSLLCLKVTVSRNTAHSTLLSFVFNNGYASHIKGKNTRARRRRTWFFL